MNDPFDLQRFRDAQDPVWPDVMEELREGRKRTHWMWFVFPQSRGLGSSPMAQRYAIASLKEAEAYLAHPVLGKRLITATQTVNAVSGRSAHAIFGSPDDMKFHSCMTLFSLAQNADPAFREAIGKYFEGREDAATLRILGR